MNSKFWQRHWKWITPCGLLIVIVFFMSPIGNAVTDIVKVYADANVYENALEKAQLNARVNTVLGTVVPIDKMALVEGSVNYSNNNNTLKITVRIKGTNGNGKLDIVAHKIGEIWEYEIIKIRIKDPKETIVILD